MKYLTTKGRPPVMMRWVAFVLALALPAAGSLGCARAPAPVPANGLKGLKIGLLPIVEALPFYVAAEKGYFAAEKLPVELVPFKSAADRDAGLQAGATDAQVADLVAAALMVNAGVPVKAVSLALGATPAEGRFALLAAPGSGITSPGELAGVEIGVSKNSIIEYATERMLVQKGIESKDIKYSSVPAIPVRFELLMKGQLKAATLPDPLAFLAERQGARLILDDTQGDNLTQTVILFRQPSLAEKGPSVSALLRAYRRAVADVNANPDAYRGLLVEKGGLPEPIREQFKVDHFPDPQLPARGDVERVTRWLFERGLTRQRLGYADLTDGGFLPR